MPSDHVLAALCAAGCACAAVAHPVDIYGLTPTSLIRFDPKNPDFVTGIGNHGLQWSWDTGMGAFAMTYNPDKAFFYVLYRQPVGDGSDFTQSLARIIPSTGEGAIVADLGLASEVGAYSALEYVNSLGTIVTSRGPLGGKASALYTLNVTGETSFLADNGMHNAAAAFDWDRSIFYTTDLSGASPLFLNSPLAGGAPTNLGEVPFVNDLAYGYLHDGFYTFEPSTSHIQFLTVFEGGIGPVTVEDMGLLGGDYTLTGIAYTPTPGAGSVGLMALVWASRRRRRPTRHP